MEPQNKSKGRPKGVAEPEGPLATHVERTVFVPLREASCDVCGLDLGRRAFIVLDQGKARCMKCAGLHHLVYLPSGHALLTRRAGAASATHAVVLKWSRPRKRYERQGLLVEAPALLAAAKALGLSTRTLGGEDDPATILVLDADDAPGTKRRKGQWR